MLTVLFLVLSLFVVISISAFEIITKEDIHKNIVGREDAGEKRHIVVG